MAREPEAEAVAGDRARPRWRQGTAGALALLCLLLAVGLDRPSVRRAVLASGAHAALVELAELAGLRDTGSARAGAASLPVVLAPGPGPDWLGAGVADALAAEGSFLEGESAHVLRVEAQLSPSTMVVQLRLWRQGWDVRGGAPVRLHFAPWWPLIAGVLGAAVAWRMRRVGPGLLVAGACAQLGMLTLPRPAGPGYVPSDTGPWTWGHDPLRWALVRWGAEHDVLITAALGGVLATCLVLVAFDHRRDRSDRGSLTLSAAGGAALAWSVGIVGWVEGASRSGLLAARGDPVALAALVSLVALWVAATWPDGGRAGVGPGSAPEPEPEPEPDQAGELPCP